MILKTHGFAVGFSLGLLCCELVLGFVVTGFEAMALLPSQFLLLVNFKNTQLFAAIVATRFIGGRFRWLAVGYTVGKISHVNIQSNRVIKA